MTSHATSARALIDGNLYMTLATADTSGTPWATPVYFSPRGYHELLWVSAPGAQHSRNVAVQPQVGIVIFDSTVPIGSAAAIYMRAHAAEVPDAEVEQGSQAFRSRRPEVERFGPDELTAPAPLRLFRAAVLEQWILLGGRDPENPTGIDMRVAVDLR